MVQKRNAFVYFLLAASLFVAPSVQADDDTVVIRVPAISFKSGNGDALRGLWFNDFVQFQATLPGTGETFKTSSYYIGQNDLGKTKTFENAEIRIPLSAIKRSRDFLVKDQLRHLNRQVEEKRYEYQLALAEVTKNEKDAAAAARVAAEYKKSGGQYTPPDMSGQIALEKTNLAVVKKELDALELSQRRLKTNPDESPLAPALQISTVAKGLVLKDSSVNDDNYVKTFPMAPLKSGNAFVIPADDKFSPLGHVDYLVSVTDSRDVTGDRSLAQSVGDLQGSRKVIDAMTTPQSSRLQQIHDQMKNPDFWFWSANRDDVIAEEDKLLGQSSHGTRTRNADSD